MMIGEQLMDVMVASCKK